MERFRTDGVVCLRGALSAGTLELAEQAFEWSLGHPGPGAAEMPATSDGVFYQDLANPDAFAAYDRLLTCREIFDPIAALWQKPDVWFMYEQVFTKNSGTTRRTPWHQDSPYLPVQGNDLAVMWISFGDVPGRHALEFVRGSHTGPIYDGSSFDPDDDTAPVYGDGTYPRLPDIEAERDRWPIVRWATAPGDVVVFHPAILHGGGDTTAGFARRTLSLRFFGEDATVARRPEAAPPETAVTEQARHHNERIHPLTRMRTLPEGTPFRDPGFPKIR